MYNQGNVDDFMNDCKTSLADWFIQINYDKSTQYSRVEDIFFVSLYHYYIKNYSIPLNTVSLNSFPATRDPFQCTGVQLRSYIQWNIDIVGEFYSYSIRVAFSNLLK